MFKCPQKTNIYWKWNCFEGKIKGIQKVFFLLQNWYFSLRLKCFTWKEFCLYNKFMSRLNPYCFSVKYFTSITLALCKCRFLCRGNMFAPSLQNTPIKSRWEYPHLNIWHTVRTAMRMKPLYGQTTANAKGILWKCQLTSLCILLHKIYTRINILVCDLYITYD